MELFPADENIHGTQVQSELLEFSEEPCHRLRVGSVEEPCRWLSERLLSLCLAITALFSSAYPGTTGLTDAPLTYMLVGTSWGAAGAEV